MNRTAIAIACLILPWAEVSAGVRPLKVSAEARKEMAKYSLSAYENGDLTNRVWSEKPTAGYGLSFPEVWENSGLDLVN